MPTSRDAITLTNWPITGPMFTGPQQTPFVCTTIQGAVGRQPLVDSPTAPGYRVTNAQGQLDRLQPQLLDRDLRQLLVPARERRQPRGAARRRQPPGRHGQGDAGRRPHGRLRRPSRGRLDQPLPLQHRDAGAAPGARQRGPGRHEPVEPQAAVLVPGRRGDRPHPGHGAQRIDEPRHPRPGLGHRAFAAATTPARTTT